MRYTKILASSTLVRPHLREELCAPREVLCSWLSQLGTGIGWAWSAGSWDKDSRAPLTPGVSHCFGFLNFLDPNLTVVLFLASPWSWAGLDFLYLERAQTILSAYPFSLCR